MILIMLFIVMQFMLKLKQSGIPNPDWNQIGKKHACNPLFKPFQITPTSKAYFANSAEGFNQHGEITREECIQAAAFPKAMELDKYYS